VEWDMEHIGDVREVVQEVIVDRLHLMTEMQFYPYRVLKCPKSPLSRILVIPGKDMITYLEMTRRLLSDSNIRVDLDTIAEELDLSDEEMMRLKEQLDEFLNKEVNPDKKSEQT